MMGLRKLKRGIESGKYNIKPLEKLVWAYMIYGCEDCGYKTRMFLEETLERDNGEAHKPVPFMIRCPRCKNFHCYDITGLVKLPEPTRRKPLWNYFKDDKKTDCGVPVIVNA